MKDNSREVTRLGARSAGSSETSPYHGFFRTNNCCDHEPQAKVHMLLNGYRHERAVLIALSPVQGKDRDRGWTPIFIPAGSITIWRQSARAR